MTEPFDLERTPLEDGVTLIEASAGTGKTFSLAGIVVRLLAEGHVDDVGRVLVVTFTNAAAGELVERIRAMLLSAGRVLEDAGGDDEAAAFLASGSIADRNAARERIRAAIANMDQLSACTIHAFCQRVLQESAFETGVPFELESIGEDKRLLRRVAEDFWRRRLYSSGDLAAAAAAALGLNVGTLADAYAAVAHYPSVRLEPQPPPVSTAVERLNAAARRTRASWNRDEIRALLQTYKFNSRSVFRSNSARLLLDRVEGFCSQGADHLIDAVLALSPTALAKHVLKSSRQPQADDSEFFLACSDLDDAVRELGYALRAEFVSGATELLREQRLRLGVVGYDDLLHDVHAALRDPARREALRARLESTFQAVLIDEFQDTDTIQYEIFRRLFANVRAFYIGDPKQSIYGFRGADVFAYIRGKRDAGHPYTLIRNWRSTSDLVAAVNLVFGGARRPFVFDQIPFTDAVATDGACNTPIVGDDRRALHWLLFEEANKARATSRVATAVAQEIVRLLDSEARLDGRALEPADIAVLVRANDQAQTMLEALRAVGVPAVVSQAGSIFHSEELVELQTVVRAVLHPYDERTVRAALATRLWGLDASSVSATCSDERRWQEILDFLDGLQALWRTKSLVAMTERFMAQLQVRARLLGLVGGARRLTNLLHTIEVTHRAILADHLSPEATLAWFARVRGQDSKDEITELRLESDERAVDIVTIHKSKGLEYEIVFCPFFWDVTIDAKEDTVLVHRDDGSVACVTDAPAGSPDYQQWQAEATSEAIRLAYVALTRAKRRCYIAPGPVGSKNPARNAPSYLMLQPADADASDAGRWVESCLTEAGARAGELPERVRELCDRHRDVLSSSRLEANTVRTSWTMQSTPPTELAARTLTAGARARLAPRRIASFTSLSTLASAGEPEAPAPAERPDHADPALAPTEASAVAASGILAFARGARAGICLHEVLERCDFADPVATPGAANVAEILRRHGLLAAGRHPSTTLDPVAAVQAMLGDVATCKLPQNGFSLSEVDRTRCLTEWPFLASLSMRGTESIAGAFERSANTRIATEYPRALRSLDRHAIDGYLTGFVDLVFEHGGRWYIVDWKSNYLGSQAADYGADSLWRAMTLHHYVLQYHIYVVALHRHLGRRLTDYDFARHIGGVYYGFLRAIRPETSTGWFFDRPSAELVQALDDLLGR